MKSKYTSLIFNPSRDEINLRSLLEKVLAANVRWHAPYFSLNFRLTPESLPFEIDNEVVLTLGQLDFDNILLLRHVFTRIKEEMPLARRHTVMMPYPHHFAGRNVL